jgi:hypothetical protein
LVNVKPAAAINEYIWDQLDPMLLSSDCPPLINIEVRFASFLRASKNIKQLPAQNLAEKWKSDLLRKVQNYLDDWTIQRGHEPAAPYAESVNELITWRNPRFEEITGRKPIHDNFVEVAEWLRSMNGKDFLFAAALCLKELGSTEIYITDSPGDGGIDLIGFCKEGPLSAFFFLVQAKTGGGKGLSRDTVLQEYGKFKATMRSNESSQYNELFYRTAKVEGRALIYLFCTNMNATQASAQAARDLGIPVRPFRSLALSLCKFGTKSELSQRLVEIRQKLKRDLDYNIAQDLPGYLIL